MVFSNRFRLLPAIVYTKIHPSRIDNLRYRDIVLTAYSTYAVKVSAYTLTAFEALTRIEIGVSFISN